MNKLLTLIIACALCAGVTMGQDSFPVKLTVASAGTTATADVDLTSVFGTKCMYVERVTASGISGNGTGVVTFASIDHGVATTLATSGSLVTGSLYAGYPARTVSTTDLVQIPLSTNGVFTSMVTTTNTVTASLPYLLKTVRVSVAQTAVSGATVYNAVIFVK